MTYGGRVAKDASAKPYKALALDLVGNAHRRHDKAVEAGLSSHNRIEKTEQARPNIGGDMKAAYEAGLARQAFEPQRGARSRLSSTLLSNDSNRRRTSSPTTSGQSRKESEPGQTPEPQTRSRTRRRPRTARP